MRKMGVVAVGLLCFAVRQARAEPPVAAIDLLRGAASGNWRRAVLAAPAEAARRQLPFLDYIASGAILPVLEWDDSGRVSSVEGAIYVEEDNRVFLPAAFAAEPPQVQAAILAHEFRHHYDRRVQERWIGGSDSEFRAYEAQALFWESVQAAAESGRTDQSRELDARLDDLRRGFLRDFVEIHFSITAAQQLASVRSRLARMEAAPPPLEAGEHAVEEFARRREALREEERLLARDLELQRDGR